jgi:hypothetical protein
VANSCAQINRGMIFMNLLLEKSVDQNSIKTNYLKLVHNILLKFFVSDRTSEKIVWTFYVQQCVYASPTMFAVFPKGAIQARFF